MKRKLSPDMSIDAPFGFKVHRFGGWGNATDGIEWNWQINGNKERIRTRRRGGTRWSKWGPWRALKVTVRK